MSEKNMNKTGFPDSPCDARQESDKSLRELAENIVREKSNIAEETNESLSPDESRRLIYELEVHQVELEMQNRELLRIQDELEKSQAWYLDLYDLAPVGYLTLNDRELIMEANLTAASLLGVRRNSLGNQPFTRYVHHADQDTFYMHQKALLKTGMKQMFELRMKKNDESIFWTHMETTLAYGENNMLTCRAVMSDITDKKRMEEDKHRYEEQILQNQKLESLGILAGGIAHNFNNLLTGIFGYIELAGKKADNPEVSRYLSEALKMSERAKSLTGQLLTFSNGGSPVKKNGPLFPLIKDSVQYALSGSDILCRFNIDDHLSQCNFDINQICQMIDDIILNARQAMPDGGVIEITADNILLNKNEIASLPEGNYIRISIKDSGPGMSPEILAKIFDPFFTTRSTGYGLGLATTYSIISRHGGTIKVESQPGKGSEVIIYLPAAEQDIQLADEKIELHHRGGGTIIIMDDEECIRDSLSEMLMSMGYDVIHMEEGDEVISFLKEEPDGFHDISGVILDLIIPGGMGGKAAVSEIRKILPDIPVFAISGYTDDPVMRNPGDYGFTASISKPFLMSELSDMLNKYLD